MGIICSTKISKGKQLLADKSASILICRLQLQVLLLWRFSQRSLPYFTQGMLTMA
ncbi:hypothetical protein H6G94_36090 [Nostoc punctiforme FACHB-252]|uniref:Transposase n=1 Tax=Nostoc punctiforme FACHB-252 TaxID=1357509 RepID=A0ABR8HL14_NOSPU|nr:hypothetical protein [Nostoc punctiforme]MBD2616578.1 hypothetical protein [Nostoc punctiforme FACHB-252]